MWCGCRRAESHRPGSGATPTHGPARRPHPRSVASGSTVPTCRIGMPPSTCAACSRPACPSSECAPAASSSAPWRRSSATSTPSRRWSRWRRTAPSPCRSWGGHHGANALAEAVADATGGMAAVTTASEARLGLALDAPPPGWTVADPPAAKAVTAALLAGEPVRLVVEAGDPTWITDTGLDISDDALPAIRITDRARSAERNELVLHPPILALGVGCERDTEPAELEALARATLAEHGLAPASVACVISLDLKEDEPAVAALAVSLGVPARFFDAPRLEAETPRLANPSEEVFRAVGCHGVAEASALAAAGTDGVLVVPKRKSARATCAVARATAIDPNRVGRPARQPHHHRRRAGPCKLAHAGGGSGGDTGERRRRLRPLSRPHGRRAGRRAAPRLRPRRGGGAGAPGRWCWRPRGNRWCWSPRATPASTPWRAWSSNSWNGSRSGGASPSPWSRGCRRCRWPPRAPARPWGTISAPSPSPI